MQRHEQLTPITVYTNDTHEGDCDEYELDERGYHPPGDPPLLAAELSLVRQDEHRPRQPHPCQRLGDEGLHRAHAVLDHAKHHRREEHGPVDELYGAAAGGGVGPAAAAAAARRGAKVSAGPVVVVVPLLLMVLLVMLLVVV